MDHSEFMRQFAQDVHEGLRKKVRHIPSKYIYDEKGSQLFQKIMAMPEYYLTEAEREIFTTRGDKIVAQIFESLEGPFEIVELGAGDATKTECLLDEVESGNRSCTYTPVDIDPAILKKVEDRLSSKYQNIDICPFAGDYQTFLQQEMSDLPRVFFFFGSNIGNYPKQEANALLQLISSAMQSGDLMLIGLDSQKAPHTILKAYDDPHGITESFNLNLLERINRDLGGNFPVDQFLFYTTYDLVEGEVRSFLVNRKPCEVAIEGTGASYSFEAWNFIHTEISRKYHKNELPELGRNAGLRFQNFWTTEAESFWVAMYMKA